MSRLLLLYEDSGWRSLRPLTDLIPVPSLAFGGSTLGERWRRRTGLELLAIETRERAANSPVASRPPLEADAEVLVINAAVLPGPWLDQAMSGSPALFRHEGRLIGARLPFQSIAPGLGRGSEFEKFLAGMELPVQRIDARVVAFPWNLIEWNAEALTEDLAMEPGTIQGEVHPQAVILEPERVTIEPGARIDPLALLDAREGPIRIGSDVVVRAHTVVTGPCVVGSQTELLGGVVARSTIGPQCRLAGEVEECIWQGYANKRHHGFVGHSVIGEWVNLGALTTTSDLKNNYGSVRMWVDGREVDSGVAKLGAVIGSHVKTGIGTLLPTGVSVGVGANLFGGGRFAPKYLPSFSWWDGEHLDEHRFEPFLKTARMAAKRRGRMLDAKDEATLRELFASTAHERESGLTATLRRH